jgi:hypothetical protein
MRFYRPYGAEIEQLSDQIVRAFRTVVLTAPQRPRSNAQAARERMPGTPTRGQVLGLIRTLPSMRFRALWLQRFVRVPRLSAVLRRGKGGTDGERRDRRRFSGFRGLRYPQDHAVARLSAGRVSAARAQDVRGQVGTTSCATWSTRSDRERAWTKAWLEIS